MVPNQCPSFLSGLSEPRRRSIAGLLALLLLSPIASAEPSPALKSHFVIGVDLGMSAKDEPVSRAIFQAIQDVTKTHNASRGASGSLEIKLRLMDNRGNPERSWENLRKLESDPAVGAIVAAEHGTRSAARLTKITKPLFSVISGPVEAEEPSHLFRLVLADSIQLALIFENAKQQGLGRLSVVLQNNPRGRYCQQSLLPAVANNPGVQLVSVHWINLVGNDFRRLANQVRQQGSQGLIWCASAVQLASFYRELANSAHKKDQRKNSTRIRVYTLSDVQQGFSELSALKVLDTLPITGIAPARETAQKSLAYWQAHDLMSMLVIAAGNTKHKAGRDEIINALRDLPGYSGALGYYDAPFKSDNAIYLGQEVIRLADWPTGP